MTVLAVPVVQRLVVGKDESVWELLLPQEPFTATCVGVVTTGALPPVDGVEQVSTIPQPVVLL